MGENNPGRIGVTEYLIWSHDELDVLETQVLESIPLFTEVILICCLLTWKDDETRGVLVGKLRASFVRMDNDKQADVEQELCARTGHSCLEILNIFAALGRNDGGGEDADVN